ncbi:MAG: Flp family type IVb pilin [Alphaproteobacteria bacterium]|nr:Flp family type IVb pilin [Alphaproteobacteria bacterium]
MRIDILKKIRKDESGATAIEYGLIAALVSVAAIGALTAMGGSLNTMFQTVSDSLTTAVG